jgi:hypothetical protein
MQMLTPEELIRLTPFEQEMAKRFLTSPTPVGDIARKFALKARKRVA